MNKQYYVYIMALSDKTGPIYIGVTSNLEGRVWEHKNSGGSSHVQKYKIFKLVYYEVFDQIDFAIDQEKRLKKWRRDWKNKVITDFNPDWSDLFTGL